MGCHAEGGIFAQIQSALRGARAGVVPAAKA